jgi:hypothetical protein
MVSTRPADAIFGPERLLPDPADLAGAGLGGGPL